MWISKSRSQPLRAAIFALVPVAIGSQADAQSLLILPAALGEIAAASSGVTTFSFDPSSGVVSRISGSGVRVATTTARIQVQLTCPGKGCANNVNISAAPTGSLGGRAEALTNITFAAGSGVTMVSQSIGSAVIKVGGSSGIFYIGADYPIDGDNASGSTGTASSPFSVTATDSKNKWTVTNASTATALVYRSMNLTQGSTLNFGRIVRPSTGSAIISLDASTGAITATPAVALSTPAPTRATYTITAEGGSSVTINVSPTTFTLSGPSSSSLPVTLSSTSSGSVAMGGTLGTGVTYSFGVGGSMTISSATANGGYSGSFGVTVNYN